MKCKQDLKVGDTVRVIDTGRLLINPHGWLRKHVNDDDLKIRFAYGDGLGYWKGVIRVTDRKFKVKIIAENKAYIETLLPVMNGYIIELEGLEKC